MQDLYHQQYEVGLGLWLWADVGCRDGGDVRNLPFRMPGSLIHLVLVKGFKLSYNTRAL